MSESADIRSCPRCGGYFRALDRCQRDGEELVETSGLIERYRIVDRIGDGGMGAVYKAVHLLLESRIVALKLLHRELARDDNLVQRFFREARASSSVDNDHIIDVIDFGVTNSGDAFLVMEYVEGKNLRVVIDDDAPLTLVRSFHIALQIAEGLYAAHRKGIVHRDLKPENILLRAPQTDKKGKEAEEDYVKLLDFGIAQLSDYQDARITRAGMIIGTPAYMSPEQASSQDVDERADIYALGTILYEMLVGHCPFVGSNAKEVLIAQLTKEPTPPKVLRADIPSSVQRVIMRCLDKEADNRPKTMMYLAYELRDALTKKTGAIPILDIPEADEAVDEALLPVGRDVTADVSLPGVNPAKRRQLLMVIGLVAAMALSVIVTLAIVGGKKETVVIQKGAVADAKAPAVAIDARVPSPKKVATKRKRGRKVGRKTGRRRRPRHGSTKTVAVVRSKKPVGQIYILIKSSPPGAAVADGRIVLGKTPLKVSTAEARSIQLYKTGWDDKQVRLAAKRKGVMTVRLNKQVVSWDVLSVRQLKGMVAKGQISRRSYERRKAELKRKRDKRLTQLRLDFQMRKLSKAQFDRLVKAAKESYR